MNKTAKTVLFSIMLTALFCGCETADFWHPGDTVNTGPASQLASKLASLPNNTVSNPHNIKLKVGSILEFDIIKKALNGEPNKYVSLDLTGSTVTTFGENTFQDCITLVSVIIPNSITSIGISVFSFCTSLTSVTISNSVISIGYNAFADCSSLTSITIGNRVTSIGERAFLNCTSLTSVTIPDSVTSIGKSAFSSCTNLSSVTIGISVTSIGDYAFNYCDSLASVTFQGTIPSSAFSDNDAFPGDLRDKFYASNPSNGTPGTYTRTSGSSTWTRQ